MVKVGLYGIGLNTYWDQFEGLFDKLSGYQKEIAGNIEGYGVEVVDVGIVFIHGAGSFGHFEAKKFVKGLCHVFQSSSRFSGQRLCKL